MFDTAARHLVGLVIALLAVLASQADPARAQDLPGERMLPERLMGNRTSLGFAVGIAIPQAGFAEFAGVGVEATATLLVENRAGWLGLRVSGEGALFRSVDSPVTGGGRLTAGSRTASLDVGPEVMVSEGSLRPYGYGTVGGIFALVDSSIEGGINDASRPPTFSDVTYVFKVGGGLYIPVTTGERSIMLDLGTHLRWNGDTRFLRGDALTLTPTGQFDADPVTVGGRLLVFTVGAVVGV